MSGNHAPQIAYCKNIMIDSRTRSDIERVGAVADAAAEFVIEVKLARHGECFRSRRRALAGQGLR